MMTLFSTLGSTFFSTLSFEDFGLISPPLASVEEANDLPLAKEMFYLPFIKS